MQEPTYTLDFGVVAKAQINYSELARLCGVTRATARLWVLGGVMPSEERSAQVGAILRGLDAAVSRKLLPLTSKAKKKRDQAIATAVEHALSFDQTPVSA